MGYDDFGDPVAHAQIIDLVSRLWNAFRPDIAFSLPIGLGQAGGGGCLRSP
ncbi:hypothetical protein GCM10022204_36010 [Microlunatus aurantiacus]|uniref:Uncharacterized protein n=1 Tax=Microlunatus aurantiacus TaxID=446786 RepID=A0ABP7E3F7_9ACTN